MADPVAEVASEQAANNVAAVVEGAVAQVEAATERAEQRAEAAEAALEVMADAARRDQLHDDIEEVTEDLEAWQSEHGEVHNQLNQRLMALEERCNLLETKQAEASQALTLLTVSTRPASEAGTSEQPTVTVTTVEPGNVDQTLAGPVVPARAANRPRWI